MLSKMEETRYAAKQSEDMQDSACLYLLKCVYGNWERNVKTRTA